jgi:nicotinamidase/pyrazinamidase
MKNKEYKRKICSFIVDAQKGFTPICPNELPVLGGDEIVSAILEQNKVAEIIVGSKDCHPNNAIHIASAEHPQFTPVVNGGENVDIYWNAHCIVGTKGNELLDGLPKVEEFDYFVFKGVEPNFHPYSACYHDLHNKMSTGVIEYLRSNNITDIIIAGLATDYCVATTAKHLKIVGFDVWINLDACRGISADTTNKAIKEMEEMGIIIIDNINEFK